jgi:hypothetical protein
MPRHIACLTFDFDAMSGMIAWGLTSPTPISRGEFGAIGRGHRMMMLERLVCGLIERGAVFTTMEEAAREYQGRRART